MLWETAFARMYVYTYIVPNMRCIHMRKWRTFQVQHDNCKATKTIAVMCTPPPNQVSFSRGRQGNTHRDLSDKTIVCAWLFYRFSHLTRKSATFKYVYRYILYNIYKFKMAHKWVEKTRSCLLLVKTLLLILLSNFCQATAIPYIFLLLFTAPRKNECANPCSHLIKSFCIIVLQKRWCLNFFLVSCGKMLAIESLQK